MLHVVLLILKILGIILLIVLGVLLSALYAVLFAAVSYRIQARREDTFQVSASAVWLFRIFTIRFLLDEKTGFEPFFQVKFFGRPLWGASGDEGKKKAARRWKKRWRTLKGRLRGRRKSKDSERAGEDESVPKEIGDSAAEEAEEVLQKEAEPEDIRFREEDLQLEPESRIPLPEPAEKAAERPPLSGIFRKITGIFGNIRRRLKQIWKRIKGIKGRLRKLLDRKDAFLNFWNLEEHRRARGAFLEEGRYLWRKSRPKKIKGQIIFGFPDPCHTGLAMGAAGMLCAWYPGQLQIVPDFEQEILKGDILIKGRIRCYIFVRILLRIWRNKDIRHMYQHWQEL